MEEEVIFIELFLLDCPGSYIFFELVNISYIVATVSWFALSVIEYIYTDESYFGLVCGGLYPGSCILLSVLRYWTDVCMRNKPFQRVAVLILLVLDGSRQLYPLLSVLVLVCIRKAASLVELVSISCILC
jgi:hypothetical protein